MKHDPKAGTHSYFHFRGSLKKTDNSEFDGLFGLHYDPTSSSRLPDADMALLRAAAAELRSSNPLYQDALATFELDVPAFPTLTASDCTMTLASIPENSQHNKIGSQAGLFCSARNIDPASHVSPLDGLSVGAERMRSSPDTEVPVKFSDRYLEGKIFPFLAPHGRGIYHPSLYKKDRAWVMSPSHYVKSRLRSPLDWWRRHLTWSFFQFDWIEKQRKV
jgi:hypothetical protein